MKLFILFFALSLCTAFKFHPMSQSLELSSSSKASQFIVENDGAENMAIELSVKERKMDENGKESLSATSLLSIFPPQMIIPPKEKRTVRVIWNGDSKVNSEQAFRVVAEQLPLNVTNKKKGTGITMLMKYVAAFYVSPPDSSAKISVSLVSSEKGKLSIKVTNSGNKHQIIFKPKLLLKKGDKKWSLSEKELTGFAGENVLAGSERVFILKVADLIPNDAEALLKLEE